MAKIVVMPDGNWLSHVSRPLEIACVLREMGHDVLFAGDGEYMRLPRERGFEIHRVWSLAPDHVLRCSRSGRANWYGYDSLKRCVDEDLRIFSDLSPDLVLGDFRLSLSTSCEIASVPFAVTLNAAWTNYYTATIKAPEHLAATRLIGKPLANLVAPLLKAAIVNLDALPYRKLRRERGLEPRGNIWDMWRGDLNLMVDTPSYGPTANLPDNFHYIGPICWEPEIPAPVWLDQLDPERPTIYFTMGSTGFARFFEQAVEIFGDSDYQCLMTTAGMAAFDALPENFFVTDYAPGSRIMEKSDVVVCQGGNGTVYQAMASGVPIVGIPTMHDQEFNLDRVVDLGIGIHLSELRFRPEHLVDAIEKVLCDSTFRENAESQRRIVATFDGPSTGARLIDELVGSVRTE